LVSRLFAWGFGALNSVPSAAPTRRLLALTRCPLTQGRGKTPSRRPKAAQRTAERDTRRPQCQTEKLEVSLGV